MNSREEIPVGTYVKLTPLGKRRFGHNTGYLGVRQVIEHEGLNNMLVVFEDPIHPRMYLRAVREFWTVVSISNKIGGKLNG